MVVCRRCGSIYHCQQDVITGSATIFLRCRRCLSASLPALKAGRPEHIRRNQQVFLGIEIGGTKLQLGVGRGDGELVALERHEVISGRRATGIISDIESTGRAFKQRFDIQCVGVGFGGPVDRQSGCITKSHQISGWDRFPFVEWCRGSLGLPVVLGNDCDCAALAEAVFGAGKGASRVFYVTVGTGIGGGFVVDGKIEGTDRPAIAEIGHLRPGLDHRSADETIESVASGPGIVALARRRMDAQSPGPAARDAHVADLLNRCDGEVDQLNTKMIAGAAADGNQVARQVLAHAVETLGWGMAQVVTLLAPQMVVVGGGVSLMPEELFFEPLKQMVARYVFPPLAQSYSLEPAMLGEEVVVHGALVLCRDR